VAAKASKPGQKPVGEAPAKEAAPAMTLPPKGAYRKLINSQLEIQSEISGLSGDMGKLASTAAEKQHVNKKAAGIAKALELQRRKNPKRFQETWFNLMHAFEEMEFQKHADKQGQLDLKVAEESAGADDEADAAEGVDAESEEPAGAEGARSPRMQLVPMPNETERDRDVA
jgi:hypothetical protein